jgi:hypothetical protein
VCRMQLYGNSHTRLTGIIREVHKQRAKIEFPNVNKQLIIPMLFIHSPMQEDQVKEQDLEIDTWFLKKNRIIPLC